MITGEIKNQIDRIWDSFWSGGISNPLEVIEQITYLLFIRRLDDLHTLEENKANRLRQPMTRRVFPEGNDARGRPYEDYRWSRFKHFEAKEMFAVVGEHLFPYLRTDVARQLGNGDSTYAQHMKDARFTIPTPALLAKVVDMLDKVPLAERDTKGDVYEYMLAKIATAGQNGQFRTPRHIIRLMVELTAPQPTDVLARWTERDGSERERPRTAPSFCVPKADIVAQGYDFSLNRYKEVVHEAVEHRPPKEILVEPWTPPSSTHPSPVRSSRSSRSSGATPRSRSSSRV